MSESVEVKVVAPDPCEHCGKTMVYVGFVVENPPLAIWACPDEDKTMVEEKLYTPRQTTEIVSGIVVEEAWK